VGGFRVLLALAAASVGGESPELLPDLEQSLPSRIGVERAPSRSGARFRLVFASKFSNVGAGPLTIEGSRPTRRARMRAEQVITLADGSRRSHPGVGTLRYVRSGGHEHFHLLAVDTYSLRDPRTNRRVRADRKTGFCLGDRGWAGLPGNVRRPPRQFGGRTGECGRGRPGALRILEGLTPGWYDDYDPRLEGQYIDITGLAAGRYTLRHHVNPDRRLRESSFDNNFASVAIELSWPRGQAAVPALRVLRRCPGRASCRS
jgi:hypothetical protein